MKEQFDAITKDQIQAVILRMKKGKASGCDSITSAHLKFLIREHPFFLNILEVFFNQLMTNHAYVQDCK